MTLLKITEGSNSLLQKHSIKVALKCIQIIRNITDPHVIQFAAERMNFPEPIYFFFLQLKGSISVLHSYINLNRHN